MPFSPETEDALYKLAEAAYTETVEYILGDLEDQLDEQVDELAAAVFDFKGEDKSDSPALEESKKIIKEHVEELCESERLAIQYFHVEMGAELLSDDEIANAILYNWIEALIEYKQDSDEGVAE